MKTEPSNIKLIFTITAALVWTWLYIIIALAIGQLTGSPKLTSLPILNLFPVYLYHVLGIILLITWLPIIVVGIYTLGHRGVVGMSGHLINYGLYFYVRNPMYSGIFFVVLGSGLALGSTSTVIAALIWGLISFLECEREIADLEKRFGQEYLNYKKTSPIFVPNFFLLANDLAHKRFHKPVP
ncbi:hypothetical protein COT42_06640 [Candidatus Saganbacteria bacterium CG08_land_8_20_14_0_20_45_16]|uniref:Isoprenylcysteine carboxylmethyltransferase family protein n=1 Tax=Candidatus Saganbacteria bacterium CG08_land_8_20_14_0_20_45_16 TaxID=2014293 RepID=A0A2H0XXM9_UNCSA|nr:MAG: hypothetical protein COT42_06640 [Candidatus Saganbacteria bacterium CG08_land_8_20_14_0_20_45_16]